MSNVPIGDPVIEIIELAYHANIPVLLSGSHGIGKSSMFEEAARKLQIEFITIDLSLLEPVDLIGIPTINSNGRTVYCPPSFLPSEGKGILLFEELNRCPRNVRVPCLQLLTARKLNDYILQQGWLPCAVINIGADYQIDDLDPALLSRFLQVQVESNVATWVKWARKTGNVHNTIIDFVEQSPEIFDDPTYDPRSWTYASDLLKTWEDKSSDVDLLTTVLVGVVDEPWTVSFLEYYGVIEMRPLLANQIIDDYPAFRDRMNRWLNETKLDLISASFENLKKFLQRQQDYDSVVSDSESKNNVEAFLSDLPPDIRKKAIVWLKDRHFNELKAPRRSQTCHPISSEKRRAG